jgi:hypothetical protein
VHAVRAVEPVDGAATFVADGVNPPGGRGNPSKGARNGANLFKWPRI